MASCLTRTLGSCSRAVGVVGNAAGKLDKGLGFLGEVNNVVSSSLKLVSIHTPQDSDRQYGLANGISTCADISGALTMGRVGAKCTRLLSGQMIFQINDDGSFVRDKKTGSLVTHPILAIASDVFSLASKTLDLAGYGNARRLWNLGKHTQTIGLASAVANMTSSSLSIMQGAIDLRDVIQNRSPVKSSKVRSLVLGMIRDGLDILETPLGSGMVNAGPHGLTVGCVISLLGSVFGVVNNILND